MHCQGMDTAPATPAVEWRGYVRRSHREPDGQSKDLDIYSFEHRKRSVALRHYMNTDRQIRKAKTAKMSRGFSLVELMIAMAVLAVGLLGGIVVIIAATANNGRSKLHSTAVNMAQSTMEKIVAIPPKAVGTDAETKMTDCAGNTFTIETAVGGSDLIDSGAFAGSVDFSKPAVANYAMQYSMCSAGANIGYDIRWRIDVGPTPSTQLVTVSAKPLAAAGAAQFTLPFTLHQLRGNF
jgi:prepilin-type N-terminal cleavage/methylation domain-containing protein